MDSKTKRRKGISLKTRVILWGRAASRCSFAECRRELIIDKTHADDESVVGDSAHIVAEEPHGPRGDFPLAPGERNKYENLILLCKVHHKLVDDQPSTYTVERLKDIKAAHEKWVREQLKDFDPAKQRDIEAYAEYTETWSRMMRLDLWPSWSYAFLCPQPMISTRERTALYDVKRWLFTRVWPLRYPEVEDSFHNFRLVLEDLLLTFDKHADDEGNRFTTKRFYQIRDWNPAEYDRLHAEYEFHVELVGRLMLELTKAGNYVCDKVRQYIDPLFRLDEGVLVATSGPHLPDLRNIHHRAEYTEMERSPRPYPGMEIIKKDVERELEIQDSDDGECP